MTAYELTKQRYYNLIKQEKPDMLEADIQKEAELMANDWKARRDDGYVERSVTEYDVWANV